MTRAARGRAPDAPAISDVTQIGSIADKASRHGLTELFTSIVTTGRRLWITRSTPRPVFPTSPARAEHAGPVNHVLPAWDMACGLPAALAIVSADRHRTGQQIRSALADIALAMVGHLRFLAEAQV